MNIKILSIAIAASLLLPSGAVGQEPEVDAVVSSILLADPALQAKQAEARAEAAEARTANQLDDPEVGFDHFWGKSDIGRKYTVSISQAFDWPTLYGKRSRAADAVAAAADAELLQLSNERACEVRALLYEYIYNRRQLELAIDAQRLYGEISANAAEAEKQGAVTIIDLKKARLEHLSASRRARQARTAADDAYRRIVEANGGRQVDTLLLQRLQLPTFADLQPEGAYLQGAESSPSVRALQARLSADESQASLARSERLPKFSLGYAFNNEFGDKFHGITGSISLPVYSRRSQIEAARGRAAAVAAALQASEATVAPNVHAAYSRALALKNESEAYDQNLASNALAPHLYEAVAAGLITVTEYLRELDFDLALRTEMLEGRYEFATALNNLRRLAGM